MHRGRERLGLSSVIAALQCASKPSFVSVHGNIRKRLSARNHEHSSTCWTLSVSSQGNNYGKLIYFFLVADYHPHNIQSFWRFSHLSFCTLVHTKWVWSGNFDGNSLFTTQWKKTGLITAHLIKNLKSKPKLNISSWVSFSPAKSSKGLFWKLKLILFHKYIFPFFFFIITDCPMGCGRYASNFMLEIGKYWHFKNRGHLQIAHAVFAWHINLFFRDFFHQYWWFELWQGWKSCCNGHWKKKKKKHYQYISRTKSFCCLFCFPDIRATRVDHDKPYRKLLSFLLAFCKVVLLVFWYNNAPDYELGTPICPRMVFSCYFRKLWPFAPGIKDLRRQFLSCWLGQGHSP